MRWEARYVAHFLRFGLSTADEPLMRAHRRAPAAWMAAWHGSSAERERAIASHLAATSGPRTSEGERASSLALAAIQDHRAELVKRALLSSVTQVALRRFLDRLLLSPESLPEAKARLRRLIARTSPDHNDAFIRASSADVKHLIYRQFSALQPVRGLLDHPQLGPLLFAVPAGDFGTRWWNAPQGLLVCRSLLVACLIEAGSALFDAITALLRRSLTSLRR